MQVQPRRKRSAAAAAPAPPPVGGLRMEVACCDADHEGEWEGEWEECEVVADHGETCDVRIVEDGEVCCGVPRRLVRAALEASPRSLLAEAVAASGAGQVQPRRKRAAESAVAPTPRRQPPKAAYESEFMQQQAQVSGKRTRTPAKSRAIDNGAREVGGVGGVDGAATSVLWELGSKVDALDVAGTWYEAKVVGERGHGESRELLVHYKGWKARCAERLGPPQT